MKGARALFANLAGNNLFSLNLQLCHEWSHKSSAWQANRLLQTQKFCSLVKLFPSLINLWNSFHSATERTRRRKTKKKKKLMFKFPQNRQLKNTRAPTSCSLSSVITQIIATCRVEVYSWHTVYPINIPPILRAVYMFGSLRGNLLGAIIAGNDVYEFLEFGFPEYRTFHHWKKCCLLMRLMNNAALGTRISLKFWVCSLDMLLQLKRCKNPLAKFSRALFVSFCTCDNNNKLNNFLITGVVLTVSSINDQLL